MNQPRNVTNDKFCSTSLTFGGKLFFGYNYNNHWHKHSKCIGILIIFFYLITTINQLKANIKIQLIPELKMHATFTAVNKNKFRWTLIQCIFKCHYKWETIFIKILIMTVKITMDNIMIKINEIDKIEKL